MRPIAPSLINASLLLAKYLPRGKGAVVRKIGEYAVKPESRYMTTKHGAKLVISPNALEVYAGMHKGGENAFDYRDFKLCHNGVLDGGVFYDLGANVGYFTIEMLALGKGQIAVAAFEPDQRLARAIERSAALSGTADKLVLLNAMVGDEDGTRPFYVSSATYLSSAVSDSNRGFHHVEQKPMVTIDSLIAAGTIAPPTMVKMDIEASEHLAFRGGAKTFREARPHIYIEYNRKDDVDDRIWTELTKLSEDTGVYDMYFSAQTNLRGDYASELVRLAGPGDRGRADGLFLRNRDRPVRDEAAFGG